MGVIYRILLTGWFLLAVPLNGTALADQKGDGKPVNVVLSPADQLILDRIDQLGESLNGRIDRVNERIDNVNDRIDTVNDRIDNVWITMMGGFIGVMGFIGALVFWDRRTFMKRARDEMAREVVEDRKKINGIIAALRKLGNRFPELNEVLNSFGLL